MDVGEKNRMNHRAPFWICLVSVFVVAVIIRYIAVQHAYPCSGDAAHFVQHGVALSQGIPGSMSAYWSQGMILIASIARYCGYDPRLAIQITALLTGSLVPVLMFIIVFRLSCSLYASFLAGLVVSTNTTYVQYSITGFSEAPYMMFLLIGISMGFPKDRNVAVSPLMVIGAGLAMGSAGYFKGLDAAVAVLSFSAYSCFVYRRSSPKKWMPAALIVTSAFLVLLPLCLFTYDRAGTFTPGSKGAGNFYLGLDWSDSKKVYAIEPDVTKRPPVGELCRQMPARIATNLKNTTRIFSEQLFVKGFRMGSLLFCFAVIFSVRYLLRRPFCQIGLPICLLLPQVFLLSLVFVHSRLLLPSSLWVIVLFALAIQPLATIKDRFIRYGTSSVLLVFIMANAGYSFTAYEADGMHWRYNNIVECARVMRQYVDENDIIMTYGPHLAVELYTNNPLKTVELRYGRLAEIEDLAQKKNVRYIVVSDVFRSHWPIALVFNPETELPKTWRTIEDLTFPEDPQGYRYPSERIRIIRRCVQ